MLSRRGMIDDYHRRIREHDFDILALDFPALRFDRHITHSCLDPRCRICAPKSVTTLKRLRYYATSMYNLMTGQRACHADFSPNEHTADFRSHRWLLDIDRAVEVSTQVQRKGQTVGASEQMLRLRTLAQMCDAVHTDEYLDMAAEYRALVDRIDKQRKTEIPAATESQEEATEDLRRIRTALCKHWRENQQALLASPKQMDELLYVATVFGMDIDDRFAPVRTDWWAASYKPDVIVPGLNKTCNYIDIDGTEVYFRVPRCSKEPDHRVDVNVTEDSPLLAEILRLYRDTAIKHNDGFLFRPASLTARNSRRPRAMVKLLRPEGKCPHENQCTRCHETFVSGRHGRRECKCTRAGGRARPECGSWCGPACGYYTNIAGRHKRICSQLGSIDERKKLADNMGTSVHMLGKYGNGSGSVL